MPDRRKVAPSYERIAEKADCARSTVYEAIRALEAAGILTCVNRIARVSEWGRRPVRPGAEQVARHPHEQRLHVRRSAGEKGRMERAYLMPSARSVSTMSGTGDKDNPLIEIAFKPKPPPTRCGGLAVCGGPAGHAVCLTPEAP
jgi:hypothetical protein